MSDKNNPVAVALKIAEEKYKDNQAIVCLVDNFKRKLLSFKLTHNQSYYDPIAPYLSGLDGQSGCSLFINKGLIDQMVSNNMQKLIDLASIQTVAECLIFTLQHMGEEIEY